MGRKKKTSEGGPRLVDPGDKPKLAKNNKDHLADAYVLLAVTKEQVAAAPRITHLLRGLSGTDKARRSLTPIVFEYLSGSDEPDARRLMEMWERLTLAQRKVVPVEAFALAAGLTSKRMFGLIAQEAADQGAAAARLMLNAAHPAIVAASIKAARGVLGDKDRKMLHLAAGFLPVPKNQVTFSKTVNNTQVNQVALPSLDESVRQIGGTSSRFDSGAEPLALPEPPVFVEEDEVSDGTESPSEHVYME